MSQLIFSDVYAEKNRKYCFLDKSSLFIPDVKKESVSESGGTRLITKDGFGHYISSSWSWMVQNFDIDVNIFSGDEAECVDISSEEYREYFFGKDFQIYCLRINGPKSLLIHANGVHEIRTENSSYIIKPEWNNISWKPLPNQPTFVF